MANHGLDTKRPAAANFSTARYDESTKKIIKRMNHNNQYSRRLIEGIELVDKMMRKDGARDLSLKLNSEKDTANEKKQRSEMIANLSGSESDMSTISGSIDTFTKKCRIKR